jgi:hypothetical protein
MQAPRREAVVDRLFVALPILEGKKEFETRCRQARFVIDTFAYFAYQKLSKRRPREALQNFTVSVRSRVMVPRRFKARTSRSTR